MLYPKIGIRPAIDGRWGGVREGLEQQTMAMAKSARHLLPKMCVTLTERPCSAL